MARSALQRSAGAEALRRHDVIDLAPAFTEADAAALNARFATTPTREMLAAMLTELAGRVAVVSSFGAESAVLLHLVAQVDKTVPVIFVNTQKMFGETLAYRDELAERLGLTDLRVVRPDPYAIAARDKTSLRWSFDPDGCCAIRKVEPLRRALGPFDAWLSGRKGFQAKTRAALPRFEPDEGKLKLNPLADWDKAALDAYFADHDLPRHPLEAQGFASVGCVPCTTTVKPGEDPRSGRWRGWDKTECGIHGSHDPAF
ncbi:MAG: phosphoadenylyl-sulfate reductase [Sphingomonadaceae bacterium]|nr:phosphoadenylyl-sulfate reductase [Sphingomonadaceae bacterium]